VHALTIRLSDTIFATAQALARREGLSLNRLIQLAIVERARQATAGQMRQAYDLLADDAETAEVESLLAAQVEVLGDE
jgi:hypothetical protein